MHVEKCGVPAVGVKISDSHSRLFLTCPSTSIRGSVPHNSCAYVVLLVVADAFITFNGSNKYHPANHHAPDTKSAIQVHCRAVCSDPVESESAPMIGGEMISPRMCWRNIDTPIFEHEPRQSLF
jgi:hypothetical protein